MARILRGALGRGSGGDEQVWVVERGAGIAAVVGELEDHAVELAAAGRELHGDGRGGAAADRLAGRARLRVQEEVGDRADVHGAPALHLDRARGGDGLGSRTVAVAVVVRVHDAPVRTQVDAQAGAGGGDVAV